MSASDGETSLFLEALRSTGRGACDRWVLASGVDRDDAAAYQAAKDRWQSLPLLSSPELRGLALRALLGALGRPVTALDPFPSMLWPGGAGDTRGGRRFKGTLGDFVDRVLRARASVVAEKRRGWVVCPTSNADGHRVNASTTAVHAVNLDCDGRGSYEELLAVLDRVGLAYVVYQSGGWSPAAPKWHLLLPLDSPSDTSDAVKIDAHKRAYNAVRTVFGALAGLPGEGFDPTVETPCVPVFITERRSEDDPPRRVLFREGRALDLRGLLGELPEVPRDAGPRRDGAADVDAEPLSDAALEGITAALRAPMSKILSGRRDLYLCLAGALLDRGIAGDDMVSIIEQLSLRCPGDPSYTQKEVDDRHRQHVHDAETTVKKREEGGAVTRIGTLVERWPDVARAIDAVLPNPEWQSGVDWLDSLRSGQATGAASSRPSAPVAPPPVSLSAVRAAVRKLRNRKMKNETFDHKIRGAILDAALAGADLVPRIKGRPVSRPNEEPYDRTSALEAAVWSIVMSCDKELLDADALQVLLRPSIAHMVADDEGSDSLFALVVSTFKRAAEYRRRSECDRDNKEMQRRNDSQSLNWKER